MQTAMLLTKRDLRKLQRASKALSDLVTRLEAVLGPEPKPRAARRTPSRVTPEAG